MSKKSETDMNICMSMSSVILSVCDTHHTNTTQHREGERETRLFLDSTGGGAGPFSLICLVNSVHERDFSPFKSSSFFLKKIGYVHVNVNVDVDVDVNADENNGYGKVL